jgi:hypothetical protein
MADFLTRRDGTWHFVRRVPAEFASFDARVIVRHSTKVRVRDDRNGRRASRIAAKFNAELESVWRAAALGRATEETARYDTTRQYVRTLGFEYVENEHLLQFPIERLLGRLETLVGKGVADQPVARAAALGTEKRPIPRLSRLFNEFEALVADEIKDLSPEQHRIWRNSRIWSAAQFVERVGDKARTRRGAASYRRPSIRMASGFALARHAAMACSGCKPCRKSAARWACEAAVKIARLSFFSTVSQLSM